MNIKRINDETLREIARLAAESPFGVRTIRHILQKVFAYPIYDAPGKEKKSHSITMKHLKEVIELT
ncbi:MAG: hypothetical protein PHW18_05995 [Sulfuricurvum sp.]|uniref:hypothetical protein n=1 Tax=Sulfuricurvum sp. TaxID=2025608 RepID=UPI0026120F44|nr:hypothetical protein [Sulfuricurvum sp.]MDD2829108.1 hypothetical protein [Sulfuricurvum sp.]MDD4948856.1 hypothetical protein [Sulfuricurvum sp.]